MSCSGSAVSIADQDDEEGRSKLSKCEMVLLAPWDSYICDSVDHGETRRAGHAKNGVGLGSASNKQLCS